MKINKNSYRHFLSFVPDGTDNNDVTGCNEDGRDNKEGHGDKGHVDLPLPLLAEGYPALRAVVGHLGSVVEIENWG